MTTCGTCGALAQLVERQEQVLVEPVAVPEEWAQADTLVERGAQVSVELVELGTGRAQ